MILAVDVGNTNTRCGIYRGRELRAWARRRTELVAAAEYAAMLRAFLEQAGVGLEELEGMGAACVVSPLVEILRAVAAEWGKPLVEAGPSASAGLVLGYRVPSLLGPDRIAAAVGGVLRVGKPCLVADLGTAVTVDAVSKDGVFLGGAILPGIGLSLQALHRGTAALPETPWLEPPGTSIGRDTAEGMAAGIYWGLAAAVESLAERHRRELGEPAPLVVTGGWAGALLPALAAPVFHAPNLTLEGLGEIFRDGRGGSR